jgi:hypothetical protein
VCFSCSPIEQTVVFLAGDTSAVSHLLVLTGASVGAEQKACRKLRGWDPKRHDVASNRRRKARSFRIVQNGSDPRLQAHRSQTCPGAASTECVGWPGLVLVRTEASGPSSPSTKRASTVGETAEAVLIEFGRHVAVRVLVCGLSTRADADSSLIAGIGKRVALDLARVVSRPHW